jgi:acyl-CoA thioester hydrolase
MRARPAWLDSEGRMNTACFTMLFEEALDEAFGVIGLGQNDLARLQTSFFPAEVHTNYQRELTPRDSVRLTLQLIDFDDRRVHIYLEMRQAEEGWVAATCEKLAAHIDVKTRKIAPFPADVMANLAIMKTAHARLRPPAALGRVIGIPVRDQETSEPILAAGTRH